MKGGMYSNLKESYQLLFSFLYFDASAIGYGYNSLYFTHFNEMVNVMGGLMIFSKRDGKARFCGRCRLILGMDCSHLKWMEN